MKKEKIDILVVDDSEFYRKGLILMLNRIYNVGTIQEASNGIEFLKKINKKDPDLIFMDIKMPLMNGFIATKKAIHINHHYKIIALTMHKDEINFNEMILAGAKGFLLKDAEEEEFVTAINTVLSGKSYYSDNAINNLR